MVQELASEEVYECLKAVYDPEIPVNIVDLGLVYDVQIKESDVFVQMTLTFPGCGMGPMISDEADRKVRGIDGVDNVMVELVWEPMWDRNMMSEAAQLELGML